MIPMVLYVQHSSWVGVNWKGCILLNLVSWACTQNNLCQRGRWTVSAGLAATAEWPAARSL